MIVPAQKNLIDIEEREPVMEKIGGARLFGPPESALPFCLLLVIHRSYKHSSRYIRKEKKGLLSMTDETVHRHMRFGRNF